MGSSNLTVYSDYSNLIQSDNSGSTTDEFKAARKLTLSAGTDANQANRFYRDYQTVAGGSNGTAITYTLSNLTGGQGMVKVRKIYLENLSELGSGGVLTIGPAASEGWTAGLGGAIPLIPGGVFLNLHPDVDGVPVAAGTNDVIAITVPAGATVTYRLSIEGCGADGGMMGSQAFGYRTSYSTTYST